MGNDSVSIILVGTTHPGNIGATARAMGVMGLSTLLLARPVASHTEEQAVVRASGAADILERAAVYPDLAATISTHHCVYAFTARRRDMSHSVVDLRTAATLCAKNSAEQLRTALVFGPERTGLTNAELELCDRIVEIPSAANYSLNVAAAVQLACYEVYLATLEQEPQPARELASKQEIQDMLDHTRTVVMLTAPPRTEALLQKMLGRMQVLINRAEPTPADIRMLRGMLKGIEQACNTTKAD